jgi:hypothetical protein
MTTTAIDRELVSVLIALDPLGDRISHAICPAARTCDFAALREQGWSSGERILIDVAEALWTGRPVSIDLAYLASMSDSFLLAALDAMACYRGKPLPAGA